MLFHSALKGFLVDSLLFTRRTQAWEGAGCGWSNMCMSQRLCPLAQARAPVAASIWEGGPAPSQRSVFSILVQLQRAWFKMVIF
jgi:hypothetical protein